LVSICPMRATSEPPNGGGGASKTTQPTASLPSSSSSSNILTSSKLSQPGLGRGPNTGVVTGVTSRLGLRGRSCTGMGPAWGVGKNAYASASIPMPAGVGGPTPIPRDEVVVLRRFPSDEEKGNGAGIDYTQRKQHDAPRVIPSENNQAQSTGRQRLDSDSDAMALLRLASTGTSASKSPPPSPPDEAHTGSTADRRKGLLPPPLAHTDSPTAASGQKKSTNGANKGSEDFRALQLRLQRRSLSVDYAVGLVLRRHVLRPLVKDIQSFEGDKRKLKEIEIARYLGQYARGELILMKRCMKRENVENGNKMAEQKSVEVGRKQNTSSSSRETKESLTDADEDDGKDAAATNGMAEMALENDKADDSVNQDGDNSGTKISTEQSEDEGSQILPASIKLVNKDDATTLASWYNKHGDKVLPDTSMEWSNWWMHRCGKPDPGCEMAKLVIDENLNDDDGKDGNKGLGEAKKRKKRERVLGVVYFERNVLDRFPSKTKTIIKTEEEKSLDAQERNNGANDEEKKEKDGQYEEDKHCTTLLRGIRICPRINGEVARRSLLSKSREQMSNMTQYGDLVTKTLLRFVLYRALLCGSTCFGVSSVKSERAEEFYETLFGIPLCIREDDGRRFYRMEGDERWEILREGAKEQARLWMKWDDTQVDDNTAEEGDAAGDKDEKSGNDDENCGPQDMEVENNGGTDVKNGVFDKVKDEDDSSPSPAAKKRRLENQNDYSKNGYSGIQSSSLPKELPEGNIKVMKEHKKE